jgi:hypothetical protein
MTATLDRLRAATVDLPFTYHCQICEAPLEAITFSDGGGWSIRGLLMRGRRRFKSALCFEHYVDACRAARRTAAVEDAPYPRPGWPGRRTF